MPTCLSRRQLLTGAGASVLAPLACLQSPAARALSVGELAPEISATSDQGKVSLSALRGRVVLLDFWASWCEPCRHSFAWMARMQTRHGPQGLSILAVNVDEKRADAERFLTRYRPNFDIAFDPKGQTAERYQLKGMPASVLINRSGLVLMRHHGFRIEDEAPLEAALIAALASPTR